jgi:hypothetical protein
MIDATVIRPHHCAAGGKRGAERNALGRSRGGFSTKINARTNAEGLSIGVVITPGQAHDVTAFLALMQEIDCDPEQIPVQRFLDSNHIEGPVQMSVSLMAGRIHMIGFKESMY